MPDPQNVKTTKTEPHQTNRTNKETLRELSLEIATRLYTNRDRSDERDPAFRNMFKNNLDTLCGPDPDPTIAYLKQQFGAFQEACDFHTKGIVRTPTPEDERKILPAQVNLEWSLLKSAQNGWSSHQKFLDSIAHDLEPGPGSLCAGKNVSSLPTLQEACEDLNRKGK